ELLEDLGLSNAAALEPTRKVVQTFCGRCGFPVRPRRRRPAEPAQELGRRLRPRSSPRHRDLSRARWLDAQAFKSILASAARLDMCLDRLAQRSAQLLREQSFEIIGRGTRSQVAGHEEASSTCEARRAIGMRSGASASVQAVRYNDLANSLPLLGRWQVQHEPVALAFRHIEQERFGLDLDRADADAILVK